MKDTRLGFADFIVNEVCPDNKFLEEIYQDEKKCDDSVNNFIRS